MFFIGCSGCRTRSFLGRFDECSDVGCFLPIERRTGDIHPNSLCNFGEIRHSNIFEGGRIEQVDFSFELGLNPFGGRFDRDFFL